VSIRIYTHEHPSDYRW